MTKPSSFWKTSRRARSMWSTTPSATGNDIKWYAGTIYFNKPYTLLQVYGFALRAAVKEPALAIEALGYLMQMPLWPFCDAYWRISPYIDPGADPSAWHPRFRPAC